ncbi:hypothetical protein [Erwinia sp. SLM-02]|uniref:hypothetical protein n=1 Tax=Erwinia sp. SLM-02 TaxID=3020057 RepID=UPI00307FF5CC
MKFSAPIVLLLALNAQARDPFLPAGAGQCTAEKMSPAVWQLQGVIGQPGHFEAWLLSPAEQRLHVRVNDRPGGTAWRVTNIDLMSITLVDERGCQGPLRLTLKGERHDKDNRTHPASG